jgi:hypothetical protein
MLESGLHDKGDRTISIRHMKYGVPLLRRCITKTTKCDLVWIQSTDTRRSRLTERLTRAALLLRCANSEHRSYSSEIGMDDRRFDAITRALVSQPSRRTFCICPNHYDDSESGSGNGAW